MPSDQERQPWERLIDEKESDIAFSRFCLYRSMPTGKRTLSAVAKEFEISQRQAESDSSRFRWLERTSAWEDNLARIRDGAVEEATILRVKELAEQHGIPVPITEQVNAVVHEGKDPRQAVMDLMSRAPKPEGE